jgi:hypothetical protein
MILILTEYCLGDKIEKNEMGRVCSVYSVYGGEERHVHGCGGET